MLTSFPLLGKEGRDATVSRTGWFCAFENHTTPALRATPPHEKRGMLGSFPFLAKEGRDATMSRTGW